LSAASDSAVLSEACKQEWGLAFHDIAIINIVWCVA